MKTKSIQTDRSTFTIRELSVAELRTWWDAIATPGHACDITNEYAVPGISLDDLAMLCDCDVSDFDALTSRELAPIADAARELNPVFFRLREMIAEASTKIVETLAEADAAIAKGECQ